MNTGNKLTLWQIIKSVKDSKGVILPAEVVKEAKLLGYSFGDTSVLADKQSEEIVRRTVRNQRDCGKRSFLSVQLTLFESVSQYVYVGIEKALNDPQIAKMVRLSVTRNVVGILRKCPLSNDVVIKKVEAVLTEWANAA